MVEVRLLITAGASLAAAAAFLAVAYELGRHRYPSDVRFVGLAFTIWWVMFGLEALTDGLRVLLAVNGDPHVGAYVLLAHLKIVFAGVAVWGLGYYVSYLWTGTSTAALPLAAFGLSHIILFTWSFRARAPIDVEVGTWAPRLVLGGESGLLPALQPLLLVYFFLPPVVFALGLLALMPRLRSPSRRFRALGVTFVIVGWHAAQLVLANPNASGDSPVFALLSLVNVLVAALAYLAYRPPRFLQRRWGLRGFLDEADRPSVG